MIAPDQTSSRVEVIMRNTLRNLIFITPTDLLSGEYRLEVRAKFGTEIRSGALKQPLNVA